jgi:Ca2+-transporting ATPase
MADREGDGGLHLAGLAAVADPPRPGAADVVDACRRAGVRTVMITGDHPATAHAIAERLGITRWEPDVVDAEHDALDPGAALDRVGVYARVRPEQKLDIVRAWQSHGHVVAMTGDGVNDAPALRGADIGVAMGERGTEVARQAASLVLADDDLGTVVVAVGEGRRIYANIRTFLRYGLAGGLAEVLVLLGAPFLGLALPLTPAQILWINLVTHGVPGVAFGGEPMDPAVMDRPSPPPTESVLHEGLARQVAWTGALIAVVSTAAGLLAHARGVDPQTVVFLVLGWSQLTVALALRTPRPHRSSLAGRALEVSVLGAGLLQVLGVWWAPLRDLLGPEPVRATVLLAVAAAAALPGLAVAVSRRRPAPRPSP